MDLIKVLGHPFREEFYKVPLGRLFDIYPGDPRGIIVLVRTYH